MADAALSRDSLATILDNQNEVEPAPTRSQEQGDRVLDDWEIPKFRTKVRERIQEEIMKTGSQVPKTGDYLEEFAFSKAKSRKEYLDLIAGILIYVAEFNQRRMKAEGKDPCEQELDSQSVDSKS